MRRIGIDVIGLAVPESYLELADLAQARGVQPSKYIEGLGVTRMAIALPHEDPVSLAAEAGRRALAPVDKSRIGLCVVGSETGVDHSKPIAVWVHKLLGLPQQCRVYESKHACYGGTAGVLTALDWIASGSARGRSALIICSDIARYELGSPGEPTQGAGAVAMVISEEPRLLALEPGVSGAFAREVDDFWRPIYRREALTDGHYSVQCYLDSLAGAYGAWKEQAGDGAPLARRCYHVPYGKMARKAHRHAMQLDGLPEAEADATFAAQVAPSLRIPSQVGNIYTGSLWMALASLLEAEAAQLAGQRVGLFSYGSGCMAEFFAGTVADEAGAFAAQLQISGALERRRRLSFAEYEAIRRADSEADKRAAVEAPGQGAAFLGLREEKRVYRAP
ncbi:MAG TPA: hydroxymethylglutaryl-CoA synthase [Myxococcales bacterium]|nr:hydroxymethylglutaryl-CoA synthase [Myxococcales bacterium]